MVNLQVVRVNKKEGKEDEATQRKVPLPMAAALLRLLLFLSEAVPRLGHFRAVNNFNTNGYRGS